MGIILLSWLLGSCGPRTVDLARGVHPNRIDPFSGEAAERRSKARAAARSGALHCTIEGECEPAVALIAVATDQGLERCTGVLISEDRVLTNDHCVDKSLSLMGWSSRLKSLPCKGSVFVHFSGDGERPSRHAGCFEIEYRSGESGISSQDYAILKLDHPITDRKPLKVSKRGFSDQEKVRILRVQMDQGISGVYGGIQNFLQCRASHATFLYPMLNSSDTPLMTFGDCNIQPGNSGAAILNEEGEVAGIVQGYLTFKQDFDVERELREFLLDDSYGLVGIGSQTRCMFQINPAEAPSCHSIPPFTHFSPKSYLEMIGEFRESLLPVAGQEEIWSPVPTMTSLRKRYFSAPVCKKGERFEATEANFRKGVNHELRAEWRAESAIASGKVPFSLKETDVSGAGSFSSEDGTRLEVPSCR